MMRYLILRSLAATLVLSMLASTAGADAISSYTVTDLSTVTNYDSPNFGVKLSSTGADGTLTTPSGTVYAFPRTNNWVANPQSLLDTFPPFTNAPVGNEMTYGNPKNAYSYFSTDQVFLNQAGMFAGTDILGVEGHAAGSESIVYTATRQANGTFGPLTALWSSPDNGVFNSGPNVARVLDLNNAGQFLGVDNGPGYQDFFIYDPHSGVRTEIESLLPTGWAGAIPTAIDDQGRILVYASPSPYNYKDDYSEAFLLTPAGLSSNPIPAPEPTTFVTLAVAGIGMAVRRWWRS